MGWLFRLGKFNTEPMVAQVPFKLSKWCAHEHEHVNILI